MNDTTQTPTVTVTCTECGSETVVPEKFESAFDPDNDGLCDECADELSMPDEPKPTTAYGEIMWDMKGEYREAKREQEEQQDNATSENTPQRRTKAERLADYYRRY